MYWHVDDVNVYDVVDEERREIINFRSMPKGYFKHCVIVIWLLDHLFIIVLDHNMHLLHMIVMHFLFQTCVMRRNLYRLMKHII